MPLWSQCKISSLTLNYDHVTLYTNTVYLLDRYIQCIERNFFQGPAVLSWNMWTKGQTSLDCSYTLYSWCTWQRDYPYWYLVHMVKVNVNLLVLILSVAYKTTYEPFVFNDI